MGAEKPPDIDMRPSASNGPYRSGWRRAFWLLVGLTCLALGGIGAVLPVLPTTPFVLLAAFAFGKSSPRLRRWLENSRNFGPAIRDWEERGAIDPRYKQIAVGTMAGVFVISLLLALPAMVLIAQATLMGAGAWYVLTRPDA